MIGFPLSLRPPLLILDRLGCLCQSFHLWILQSMTTIASRVELPWVSQQSWGTGGADLGPHSPPQHTWTPGWLSGAEKRQIQNWQRHNWPKSSKVPQSSGVSKIQKQRERAMQVIKLWPGKGHPSKWWWGAWPDSLPEEPVKIIRKLITIVFICRRYYMQKYKIMTNISFYSGIIPKTGATSKL